MAALAGCVYVEPRGDRAYLGLLSIDTARQGAGLGKQLKSAAEDFARAQGCRWMDLRVVSPREAQLVPIYRRLGYERYRDARVSAGTGGEDDHPRPLHPDGEGALTAKTTGRHGARPAAGSSELTIQPIHAHVVEVDRKTGCVFRSDADLRASAERVLPRSAANPVLAIVGCVGGVELFVPRSARRYVTMLRNAQPRGLDPPGRRIDDRRWDSSPAPAPSACQTP